MRFAVILAITICRIAYADDVTLAWTVNGHVMEKVHIAFPIAQAPVVVRQNLILTAFPRAELLGSNNSSGRRLWLGPWGDLDRGYIHEVTPDLEPYLLGRTPKQWGTRSASFAANAALDVAVGVDSATGTMYSVNLVPPRDGTIQWRAFGTEGDDASQIENVSLGPPCIVDENAHCLVESKSKVLCVTLELNTGNQKSRTELCDSASQLASIRFSPIQCGSRLICPCPSGELVSLREVDHEVIWRAQLESGLNSIFRLESTENHVLVLCDGTCFCLATSNGDVVWSRNELDLFPFVIHKGSIVLGSGSLVHSVDIATGEVRWKSELNSDTIAGNGTIRANRLLLPSKDKNILMLDAETGTLTNRIPTRRRLGHLFSIDDSIYSLTASALDKLSLKSASIRGTGRTTP